MNKPDTLPSPVPARPLPLILFFALLGSTLLVAGGFLLAAYPYQPVLLATVCVAYAFALWIKPEWWLFLLPILLPTLDWAPWSGSLMVEEFDFLVCVTTAVGYVRMAPSPLVRPRLGAGLFIAMGLMFVISLARAWPSAASSVVWTADYMDPLNGWRVARGFLWALLLYPLLPATLARKPDALQRYFLPGMVVALALVALIALWERLAFPGLLDFTSDYRITAGFSGMHVGGAGLDGFLALTLPMAIAWTFAARGRLRLSLGIALLVLATYAILVTFSRGLYLGLALAALVSLALWVLRSEKKHRGRLLAILALLAAATWALLHAYPQGGLRVLGTGLAALSLSTLIACVSRRILHGVWFWLGALVFGIGAVIAIFAADKGIYFLGALALALALFGLWPNQETQRSILKLRAGLAALGVTGLWVTVLGVAFHHGGTAALASAVFIPLVALLMLLANRYTRPRLWELTRPTYIGLILSAVILGLTIPIAGNYYMKGRFAQSDKDWETRLRHWQSVLDIMPPGAAVAALGVGAGKLPEYYFWRNPKQDVPGSFQVRSEAGHSFVRLGAPHYAQGYGESLRYGQRIRPNQQGVLMLMLKARGSSAKSQLHIEICDKLLIYARYPCLTQVLNLNQIGVWQSFNIPFGSSPLGRGAPLWRPVQFALYNENAGTYVDVSDVSMIDAAGEELIANGDFSQGEKRWFFTSDHLHLPWHAKNIWLHLYFEQGWLGVVLFAALILTVIVRLIRVSASDAYARGLLAGVIGFLAVGLFDSLIDMPRVALLFFLTLAVALQLPVRPKDGAPIGQVYSPAPDRAKPRRRGRRARSH